MKNRFSPYLAALCVTIFAIAAAWLVDRAEQKRFQEQNRANVLNQVSTIRAGLEGGLISRIFLARGLVGYVSIHPEITQAEFEKLTQVMVSEQTGIISVALYKNNAISHIYPFKGRESAIGFNPMSIPEERQAIERAMATRNTIVAGPVNLVEGGIGFISRTPIFRSNSTKNDNESSYWGLAGIIIDRDTLFREAGLFDRHSSGAGSDRYFSDSQLLIYQSRIEIAVRGKDGLGAKGEIFLGDATIFDRDPIIVEVTFPNGSWQIAAIPEGGWPTEAPISGWLRIGGIVLAVFAGSLVFIWVRSPEQLRKAIQQATKAVSESETNYRLLADKLQESEQKFRTLYESTIDAVMLLDRNAFLDCNRATLKIFGCTEKEQFCGKNTTEFSPEFQPSGEKSSELSAQRIATAFQEGSCRFEWLHCRLDGTEFPAEVWLTAIEWGIDNGESTTGNSNSNSRVILQAVVRDISKRKAREKSLRESENKFRNLFEQSADAILLFDGGVFIDCNQAAVEMMRANNKEELLNLHPSQISPAIQPNGASSWEKLEENNAIALSKGNFRFEWVHRRMDGTEFPVEVLLTAIPLESKQILHVVWRDITERKRAEITLQNSESRLRRQSHALLDLASRKTLVSGDLNAAMREITEVATETLDVERASIWMYNEERSSIICLDLYQRSTSAHTSGLELQASDFPTYFEALKTERIIAASDACNDRITREFKDAYLMPLGITSMLDAPIRIGGQMVGVICHEHIGNMRQFALEEANFAGSLADFVALAMEAASRVKAQAELEIRVEERTATLRATNKQLMSEIIERKRSEDALRVSEEKFSKAFRSSPDIITITSLREGTYVDVNETFLNVMGFDREEVIGRTSGELDVWANPKKRARIVQMLQSQVTVRNQECEFRTKSGEILLGLVSAEIISLKGEACVLVVAADITELKQAQEALRQAEEKYRTIFENAVEGIFQTSPDGKYLSANPALARLYGYASPAELMSSIENLDRQIYVDPNRRKQFVVMMQNKQAVSRFESQVYRKDGSVIWVSENARAVRDGDENLIYYEGIVEDITARKVAEEALRYQQEQTERLLLSILPQAIADRLKQEESTIADSFEDVTVLFADIVGFTELSSHIDPVELVELLNEIFSTFDALTDLHKLEKIKTIGDAYMVVGGLPTPREDHAEAVAEMALDMQTEIERFNQETDQTVQLRVGINTGPVVAGVIGIKKFIYDLWGDTVNTASRMESHGVSGKIQVSLITYQLLKDKYLFEERGVTTIKGKGEMKTYFLIGRK